MTKSPSLKFGTAGVPDSAPAGGTVSGIARIAALGLDCMEVQFVRGVKMGDSRAAEVKQAASASGVLLSCHAPYYINLATPDRKKRSESEGRLIDAAVAGWKCGATDVVFHAGFYLDATPAHAFSEIRASIQRVHAAIHLAGASGVILRPELMGKATQFGAPSEIIALSADLPDVLPCVDFSHFIARDAGQSNNAAAFDKLLDAIETKLGRRGIENMHMHLSGVEYGDKGERKHLPADESSIKWKAILKALKARGASGRVICESPDLAKETDAAAFKTYYHRAKA